MGSASGGRSLPTGGGGKGGLPTGGGGLPTGGGWVGHTPSPGTRKVGGTHPTGTFSCLYL